MNEGKPHILSIFRPVTMIIRTLFFPFVVFVLLGDMHKYAIFFEIGLAAVLSYAMIISFLIWKSTRYVLKNKTFYLYKGLFSKKQIEFPFAKILGVNFEQNMVQQMFQIVTVKLETIGTTDENEVKLWLSKKQALYVKHVLFPEQEEVQIENPRIKQMTIKELFLMAATSTAALVGFGILFGFYTQLDELFPQLAKTLEKNELFTAIPDFLDTLGKEFSASLFLMALLAFTILLIVSWLVGIVSTVIKFANYRIERKEDKLYISYGLFNTKEITVPIQRIQAVQVKELITRQPFGFAGISVDSTGYGGENGKEAILFPFIKKKEVKKFMQQFLPEIVYQETFMSAPKSALGPYLFRYGVMPILALLLVSLIVPKVIWLVIFLPLSLYIGYWAYRDAGIYSNKNTLYLRKRIISKNTIIIPVRSIQSMNVFQTPFQKKTKLSHYEIAVATDQPEKTFIVRDLPYSHNQQLKEWYFESMNQSVSNKKVV